MVNHVRTLLLNQQVASPLLTAKGCEYVPPTYIARALPPELQRFFQTLYGQSPEPNFIHYRLWQLMAFLAGTPRTAFAITAKDPRITYDVKPAWLSRFAGTSADSAVANRLILTDRGAVADTQHGRARFELFLRVTANQLSQLQLQNNNDEPILLQDNNGRSQTVRIPIGPGAINIIIQQATLGDSWAVVLHRPPADNFVDVLTTALAAAGTAAIEQCLQRTQAPVPELQTIYRTTQHQTERQAAAVLAVAYSIEDLPKNG